MTGFAKLSWPRADLLTLRDHDLEQYLARSRCPLHSCVELFHTRDDGLGEVVAVGNSECAEDTCEEKYKYDDGTHVTETPLTGWSVHTIGHQTQVPSIELLLYKSIGAV